MPRQLFNPHSQERSQSVWGKDSQFFLRFNNSSQKWANQLYEQMRSNFWIPQKVSLVGDTTSYLKLEPADKRAYNGTIAFLVFLDSLQVNNLGYLAESVSCPEIVCCLTEQASQECLHSQSYQYLIDTVVPVEDREAIYNWYLQDRKLYDRCVFISSAYQDYINTPSKENYILSLFADYLLEAIYFWGGFYYFYNLASRGAMSATADMVRLIHRDELTHLKLIKSLFQQALIELDDSVLLRSKIYQLAQDAYSQELDWCLHLYNTGILGLTKQSIEDFIAYLFNQRLDFLGITVTDRDVKNPYRHLDRISDLSGTADTKANFFETTVTQYSQSSKVRNWDF